MANPDQIKESIIAHATENSILLVKLSSTSQGPSDFQRNQIQISHLQDELSKQNANYEKINKEVEAQLKQHKKFRDSTFRRFLHRAALRGDEFEAKAMKEEKEYFAALSSQSKTSEQLFRLKQMLDEEIANLGPLEKIATEHQETHAQIDKLYEGLFAGPTPGFPTEDDLEERFYNSRNKNEAVKSYIRAVRRVVRLLAQASGQLKKSRGCLETAQQATDNSIIFFDDALSWMKESSEHIVHALGTVDQAMAHINPVSTEVGTTRDKIVKHLDAARKPNIAQESRAMITSAIEVTQENITKAENHMKELIETIKRKEQEALEHIKKTAREYEDSRQALQQNRQGIFEQVAGFGEAAPSYSECCNRADTFCVVPPEEDANESVLDGSNNRDELEPPAYQTGEAATIGSHVAPSINQTSRGQTEHTNVGEIKDESLRHTFV
jgi:DNA-binding phage protein